MVDLDKTSKEIEDFIQKSISRFREENSNPNSIGIYCCPWSGWITTNFNLDKELGDTNNNCPDFEYVEFDFLELPEWESEYERDNPEFKINDLIKKHNHDLGDENFNQLFFEYLKPIGLKLKTGHNYTILLQMLDSNISEVL